FDRLFREAEDASVESAFWEASQEARLEALYSRQPISVYFDEERAAFVMTNLGEEIREFPATTETADGRRIDVAFVQQRPGGRQVLIGGRAVDTWPIGQIVFYPDGTCT